MRWAFPCHPCFSTRQQLAAAIRQGLQQLDEVASHKDDQNRTDHGYNRDAAYVDGDFAGSVSMKASAEGIDNLLSIAAMPSPTNYELADCKCCQGGTTCGQF